MAEALDDWVVPGRASAPVDDWVVPTRAREPVDDWVVPTQARALDPEEEERKRRAREVQPEAEGMLATAGREAAHGVVLAAVGAGTGLLAAGAAGALVGTGVLPGAGTLIGGAIGLGAGLIGGGLGGYAASTAQEEGLKLLGADDSVQRAINAKVNPWSSAAGSAAANLAGFGTGAVSGATRLGSAAISGGIEAGIQAYQGEFDPAKLATSTATGAAFAKPYAWGERLGVKGGELGKDLATRYHGSAAPKSSAGVAEEHIPPPDAGAEIGNPQSRSTEAETRGYSKPLKTEIAPEGSGGVTVGHIDPALQAVLDADRPSAPAAAASQAPEMAGRQPYTVPAEHPSVQPEPPVTPRETIEGRAPGETAGDALREMAARRRDQDILRGPIPGEAARLDARVAEALGQPAGERLGGARQAEPLPASEAPLQPAGEAGLPRRSEAEAGSPAPLSMDEHLARATSSYAKDEPFSGMGPKYFQSRARTGADGKPEFYLLGGDRIIDTYPSAKEANAALKQAQAAYKAAKAGEPIPAEGGGIGGGAGGQSLGGVPPAGGAPPGAPPPGVSPSGTPLPKIDSLSAAEKMDDILYRHTTEASARTVNYTNRFNEAQKIYPINDKTDAELYHAREQKGGFEKLPEKQQEAYKTAVDDLNKERVAAFKELVARKGLSEDEQKALAGYSDENYQHRIRKTQRGDEEFSTADPISGFTGAHKPGAMKELTFKEGVAPDGSRLVVSHPEEGKYTIWENGKTRQVTGPEEFENGQTFKVDGKTYKIERGETQNIETHARDENGKPIEYHKSALLSAFEAHQQVKSRLEFLKIMDDFKVNPVLDDFRMKAGEGAPKDWKESRVPELKGIVMDPYMRAAVDNNYQPGLGLEVPKMMQDFNRLAAKSIFWNPIPHGLNATAHHIVARGEDWFTADPKIWTNFGKSLFESWDAVINKTPELERLLSKGAPLVASALDRQNFRENYGKMIGANFRAQPKRWEELAREAKIGPAIDGVRAVYNSARDVLWKWSDFLMVSRIRELEMRGMSTEAAIKDASIHMPDYRIPIKMFGSTWFPKLASDNNFMMFGRYHMKMLTSLSHMATDMLGPNASIEERRKAFGNVVALATLGMFVKPAFDYLAEKVTGNEKAKFNPRGPLAPITGAYEAYTGERSVGSVLSNLNTLNPAMKLAMDTLSNRDFAGRTIIEPGAPLYKKAAQAAEHVAGTAISPYATFGPTIQPGTTRAGPLSTLGQQLFDVKVPTEKQIKGKRYGEVVTKREAKQREKKPRGLIEYLTP